MKKYLMIFAALVLLPFAAGYDQDEYVIFTYEQALHMALQDMLFIIDTDAQIEELQDTRNEIRDELRRVHGWGTPARGTAAYETRREIIELERQILNITLRQEQAKLSRESNLRRAIVATMAYDVSLYVMEASLILVEEDLNRANIRHTFGLISANNLRAAQTALTQAQLDMQELIRNRNTSMQNLNYLLGESLDQVTRVDFEWEIFELSDINFSNIILGTPTIRQYQIDVDRKREARRAYEGNDRDTIAELREAYERIVLERNQAITAMEVSIRRGISDLENLLLQREALIIELEDAYLAMEAILTNHELGRATLHDVNQSQLRILRIRQRIDTNLSSKWTHTFLLENPSLLP